LLARHHCSSVRHHLTARLPPVKCDEDIGAIIASRSARLQVAIILSDLFEILFEVLDPATSQQECK
jgi:hypothetical protein